MNPPNLHLTPKQEEDLIHYAKQRMARHRSRLDKRPPLWMRVLFPVGLILSPAVFITGLALMAALLFLHFFP